MRLRMFFNLNQIWDTNKHQPKLSEDIENLTIPTIFPKITFEHEQ